MKKAVVRKGNDIVIGEIDVASRFTERFRGLMFRNSIPEGYGLLIRPCSQIHMFNMKFPLDVIYLAKDGTVVHIDETILPWKIGKFIKNAESVIEVKAGECARRNISEGDLLTVEQVAPREVS